MPCFEQAALKFELMPLHSYHAPHERCRSRSTRLSRQRVPFLTLIYEAANQIYEAANQIANQPRGTVCHRASQARIIGVERAGAHA